MYEKNNLLVTGWGRTSNDNRQASRNYRRFNTATAVLHKLFIPAIARTTCMKQELFKGLDSNLQICAGGQEGEIRDFVNESSINVVISQAKTVAPETPEVRWFIEKYMETPGTKLGLSVSELGSVE